jgi:Ser-tRNA(Ala) deacylase AlaX
MTSSEGATGAGIIPATEMIYYNYEGNFQLECDAKVISCQFIKQQQPNKEEKKDGDEETDAPKIVQLCLDKTVLHAQGGGQPTDIGTILRLGSSDDDDDNTKFSITKVLMDRTTGVATHTGTIHHLGGKDTTTQQQSPPPLPLQPGDSVRITVDAANREILSECHTAGHVVDSAMARCGTTLPPVKGYHFLDGPYVEYKGKIPQDERQPLLEKLQAAFQELVQEDVETQIAVLPKAEAEAVCNRVAENYFNMNDFGDETVRIVTVAGWPCPCGGTHVKSTGQLRARRWGITGFRCKKGVVRVRYGQNWDK